jgi:hypothetical protein
MTYREMLAGLGPPPIKLGEKMTKEEAEYAADVEDWKATPYYAAAQAYRRSEISDDDYFRIIDDPLGFITDLMRGRRSLYSGYEALGIDRDEVEYAIRKDRTAGEAQVVAAFGRARRGDATEDEDHQDNL